MICGAWHLLQNKCSVFKSLIQLGLGEDTQTKKKKILHCSMICNSEKLAKLWLSNFIVSSYLSKINLESIFASRRIESFHKFNIL